MKLLVLSHMFPFTFKPVNGIFVLEQVKALAKAGVEVCVVSPKAWAPWPIKHFSKKWKAYSEIPEQDEVDGIQVYYPKYLTFPKSLLFETSGKRMYKGIKDTIQNIHKEFPFDLIHAHVALPDGNAASMIAEDFGCPFIVTIHGQDFFVSVRRSNPRKKVIGETFSKANSIILVSSKLKKMGYAYFPENKEKFIVIPNGVSNEILDFGSRLSDKFEGRRDGPIITSVSYLIKRKGIDLNIRAIKKLREEYPNIKYIIVGDGKERLALEELTRNLGLEQNVHFVGMVDHKTSLQYMSKCDVFSLPSWDEAFGVVYIEAMACGKPVIGCIGEGIEDFVENNKNGLLVKPHDVDSLVGAIDFLLAHPGESKRIGELAQNQVSEKYTWEGNADKTISVYCDVLSKIL